MIKLFRRRSMICVLATVLIFNAFSINSFAMSSPELPDNFSDLSFEERFAWVSENVEGEYVQGEVENNDNTRAAVNPITRTYYTAQRASGLKQAGVSIYEMNVKYRWSVASADPVSTVRVESVNVVDEIAYISYVRKDGPDVSTNVNDDVGYAICEVHTGILASVGYYELYQYATLHYHGGTHFIEHEDSEP